MVPAVGHAERAEDAPHRPAQGLRPAVIEGRLPRRDAAPRKARLHDGPGQMTVRAAFRFLPGEHGTDGKAGHFFFEAGPLVPADELGPVARAPQEEQLPVVSAEIRVVNDAHHGRDAHAAGDEHRRALLMERGTEAAVRAVHKDAAPGTDLMDMVCPVAERLHGDGERLPRRGRHGKGMVFLRHGGIFETEIGELPREIGHGLPFRLEPDRRHGAVLPNDLRHAVHVFLPEPQMPHPAAHGSQEADRREHGEGHVCPELAHAVRRVEIEQHHGERRQVVQEKLRVVAREHAGLHGFPEPRRPGPAAGDGLGQEENRQHREHREERERRLAPAEPRCEKAAVDVERVDEGQRHRGERGDAVPAEEAVLPEDALHRREPRRQDELRAEHGIRGGADGQPAEPPRGKSRRGRVQQQRGDHQRRIQDIQNDEERFHSHPSPRETHRKTTALRSFLSLLYAPLPPPSGQAIVKHFLNFPAQKQRPPKRTLSERKNLFCRAGFRHLLHCRPRRGDGLLDVFVAVSVRHEDRLERRRREVDALLEHGAEPHAERIRIGDAGVLIVPHRLFAEEEAEHGAGLMELHRHARFVRRFLPAGEELRHLRGDFLIEVRDTHDLAERRQTRGDGERIAGEGPRLIDGAVRRDAVHDLPAAAVGRGGKAAADDLAEAGHVRTDAVLRLRAVEIGSEAAHDFIENEDGAVLFRLFPERGEEAFHRRDHAHIAGDRLHDDRGDGVALAVHHGAERFDVIVRHDEGVLRGAFRDARAVRLPEGGRAGAGFHEEAVPMAVVAAFEFQDLVAARVASRRAEGAHGRFRAGGDEAELLDGGNDLRDELGELCLEERRRAVAGALLRRLLNGFDHRRMGVAEDHRAPGAHVVDVRIAVDVGDVRAFRMVDERRRAAHVRIGADRAVHAARHVFPRFFKGFLGSGETDHFPASSFIHFTASMA